MKNNNKIQQIDIVDIQVKILKQFADAELNAADKLERLNEGRFFPVIKRHEYAARRARAFAVELLNTIKCQ